MDLVDGLLGTQHRTGDLGDLGIHLLGGRGDGFDIVERIFGRFDGAGARPHAGGDVGGIFDDLDRPAQRIEDRIVGRLQPDLAAALAEPLVDRRDRFAAGQPLPEELVLVALGIGRLDEDAVVLALDLVERIAGSAQEIVVGVQDLTVQGEFDGRLGAVDRRNLAFIVGGLALLGRDVDGELDDLYRPAVTAHDRIIGGADPNLASALGQAAIFGRLEFAAAQRIPKGFIGRGLGFFLRDEQAVVLAGDLFQPIAHDRQEIVVGVEDVPVHVERDDRLRAVNGGDLAGVVQRAMLVGGNVGGDLDDAHHLAGCIGHRIIGGVQPDFTAALGDAAELAFLVVAGAQRRPESPVGFALRLVARHEQAVVTAGDLARVVTHGLQEIAVGFQDMAAGIETDHGHRLVDGMAKRTVRGGGGGHETHGGYSEDETGNSVTFLGKFGFNVSPNFHFRDTKV